MSTKLLTVKQVAEELSVTACTVYDMCSKQLIAHHRIGVGRGAIRIKPAELERLLRQSEVAVVTAPAKGKDWFAASRLAKR